MSAPSRIPLSKPQAAALRRALLRYTRAEVDSSWAGSQRPEDQSLIASELRSARAAFWSLFATEKEPKT